MDIMNPYASVIPTAAGAPPAPDAALTPVPNVLAPTPTISSTGLKNTSADLRSERQGGLLTSSLAIQPAGSTTPFRTSTERSQGLLARDAESVRQTPLATVPSGLLSPAPRAPLSERIGNGINLETGASVNVVPGTDPAAPFDAQAANDFLNNLTPGDSAAVSAAIGNISDEDIAGNLGIAPDALSGVDLTGLGIEEVAEALGVTPAEALSAGVAALGQAITGSNPIGQALGAIAGIANGTPPGKALSNAVINAALFAINPALPIAKAIFSFFFSEEPNPDEVALANEIADLDLNDLDTLDNPENAAKGQDPVTGAAADDVGAAGTPSGDVAGGISGGTAGTGPGSPGPGGVGTADNPADDPDEDAEEGSPGADDGGPGGGPGASAGDEPGDDPDDADDSPI